MTTRLLHKYKPRGAAVRLFQCRDDEVLVCGPSGTGKSRACLEKLHMMALVNPGMRGLIVRKTLASLGSTALATWRQKVIAEMLESGDVDFYGGSAEEPPQYRFSNGSRIMIGGMDKPTKIMSSEYDVIYVQEATELTVDDWEALTTRLRNWRIRFQQIIADCNPDKPTHWLKVRCDAGKTTLLNSRHEDNPLLFDLVDNEPYVTPKGAPYLAKLDALSGVRKLRLRDGLWAAAEGIIYDEWDEAVHLVDRFKIPDDWTRWWSVDFGYNNPFVFQWWAEDPDGRLFLYREIYHTKRIVTDHALQIKRINAEKNEPLPRALICDHDAEDRETLRRALGRSTVAAKKNVSGGIQCVQKRIKERRLFIMRDSLVERDPELVDAKKPTCTAEEILGYVWEIKPSSGDLKEQPKKEDDHGMDAKRYVVAQRDLRGRPNIRSFG